MYISSDNVFGSKHEYIMKAHVLFIEMQESFSNLGILAWLRFNTTGDFLAGSCLVNILKGSGRKGRNEHVTRHVLYVSLQPIVSQRGCSYLMVLMRLSEVTFLPMMSISWEEIWNLRLGLPTSTFHYIILPLRNARTHLGKTQLVLFSNSPLHIKYR